MIALVTGAGGFLGSRLCSRLLSEGWTVRSLFRKQCDLSKEVPPDSFVKGVDVLFHTAAAKDDAGGEARDFAAVNELGTINVLKASGKVGRIVHCSSQVVYGDAGSLAITEDFPLIPDTAYAASKINAENWTRWFQHKKDGATVVLRLAGFVETGGAIKYFIEQAAQNKPIEILSGGKIHRDYVAVDDVIEAMLAAARKDVNGWHAYNIGSGEKLGTLELAKLVCKEMDSKSAVETVSRPAPRRDCLLTIDKARKDLGFKPTPLSQAVVRHIRKEMAAR